MKNRAAQIYGYVVCVVCVITFLIALAGLITSLIDMGNPLYAGYGNDTNLASFENYKVEAMKSINKDAAYIPDEAALQKMYDSAKEEVFARTSHRIHRNLIVNSIVIVVCIIMFFVHWKWMVRINLRVSDSTSES